MAILNRGVVFIGYAAWVLGGGRRPRGSGDAP